MGGCSWFAESIEKLGENLREVRPHFFFAVPRVWEKMQAAIQAAGAQNTGLKKKIATWAKGVGLEAGRADQAGRPKPLPPPGRRVVTPDPAVDLVVQPDFSFRRILVPRQLHPVHAQVRLRPAGVVRVFGVHLRQGDERPAVERPALQLRQL